MAKQRKDILIQLSIEHDFDYKIMDSDFSDNTSYADILFGGKDLSSILNTIEITYDLQYIEMIPELNSLLELIFSMIEIVKELLGLEPFHVYPEAIYARLFIIRVKPLKSGDTPPYRLHKVSDK